MMHGGDGWSIITLNFINRISIENSPAPHSLSLFIFLAYVEMNQLYQAGTPGLSHASLFLVISVSQMTYCYLFSLVIVHLLIFEHFQFLL